MDLGKLRELSEHRVCKECGAEFHTKLATKDSPEIPALAQFCDHITEHQPTVAQWTEAHNKIQKGRESAKGRI
jgi:hypothetical protein